MKKHSYFATYLCGVLSALLLFISITTVFAKTGGVSHNAVSFKINAKTIFEKGEQLTTSYGVKIPSSMLYTDELGYGTTYVPLRTIADTLQFPIEWNGERSTATLRVDGDLNIPLLPLNAVDTKVDFFTEIVPPTSQSGTVLLKPTAHQAYDSYKKEIVVDWSKGSCVSVTVSNNSDKPVMFGLGRLLKGGTARVLLHSQVPAEQTVTRTFEINAEYANSSEPLYVVVGNSNVSARAVDVTISATQFSK